MKPCVETLVRAFRGLTKRQRGNLLWHVEKGTKILCGSETNMWFALGGG
jgi:hypothetical protein